jgi:4-amino-4-deoxy-L-arabinose transferase-like glycosyltransferase
MVTGLLFIPGLGGVHLFDWDEINFAELAREMTASGKYLQLQINFETFTEKPPFFFWLQAMAMSIFGVGEFAARFPNALLGMVVVPFLYISGKFLIDRRFGFIWAMSWFGSILPFLYFKSGIIDPYFNFFIFSGLFFLIHFIWKKSNYKDLYFSKTTPTYLWLAGIFTGLAILTKGPVSYLVIILTLGGMWIHGRLKNLFPFLSLLKYSLISLLIFSLWLLADLALNGPDFIVEFTIRQWELLTSEDAGHGGFPGYHIVVLLLGCFPASVLAIRGLGSFDGLSFHVRDFQRWMITLLLVVVILFSLVGTKIIHYSSLAYYPITFLAALTLWHIFEKKTRQPTWMIVLSFFIGVLIMVVSFALPWIGQHAEILSDALANDPFAQANLQADVVWSKIDYIPGLFYLLILIAFAVLLLKKRYYAWRTLFFGTAGWVMLTLVLFIGKIETYSQRAAVEFFEEQQGESVYVTTFGYKSYVPWYYAAIEPHDNPKATDGDWLKFGEVDKPVMISCKITARSEMEQAIPDAEFLYEKNGFLFYRRPAKN